MTCEATDCTGQSPCENGGACVGPAPSAVCDCAGTGFEGPTCGVDVLECAVDQGGCPATSTCVEKVGAVNACRCGPQERWNADRTACEPNDCSADFPHELNGQWCATKYYPNPPLEDWAKAVSLCSRTSGGVLMPFTNMREYQEAVDLQVRRMRVCDTLCGACARAGCH